jgi:hypothetical protein
MSEDVLLWILGGIIGWNVALSLWVFGHSRHDAKRDAKVESLDQEIGHQGKPGTVLDRLHRFSTQQRRIKERLDMEDDQ